MKTYIVYDGKGEERGYLQATNQNKAEAKAKKLHGDRASVSYTEISDAHAAELFGKKRKRK